MDNFLLGSSYTKQINLAAQNTTTPSWLLLTNRHFEEWDGVSDPQSYPKSRKESLDYFMIVNYYSYELFF